MPTPRFTATVPFAKEVAPPGQPSLLVVFAVVGAAAGVEGVVAGAGWGAGLAVAGAGRVVVVLGAGLAAGFLTDVVVLAAGLAAGLVVEVAAGLAAGLVVVVVGFVAGFVVVVAGLAGVLVWASRGLLASVASRNTDKAAFIERGKKVETSCSLIKSRTGTKLFFCFASVNRIMM